MNSRVLACIFLLILIFSFGCAKKPPQPKLLESMVEFDRRYVPALIFSDRGKQRESEVAIQRLREEWNGFYYKFHNLQFKYGVNITDKFWRDDFDEINRFILTAESSVKEGRLDIARRDLWIVRPFFRNMRSRNGIPYFLDGMTEFHEYIEQISGFLRGRDELTDRDYKELRKLFKGAQGSWAKVARNEIDPKLFGFDDDKIEAIKSRISYEERMLAIFAAALASGYTDKVFQSSQDLVPNFIVLYKAFGDFQPVFDQVTKENNKREAVQKEVKKETKEK